MAFFDWIFRLRELPGYILKHCILLSCAMLSSSLITLVCAGDYTLSTSLQYEYASYTSVMAVAVFFAGLFGSLLLEDILEKTGQ